MNRQITIANEYFRDYRKKLGFSSQADVKNFFGAKDITPNVDINYINLLNKRLGEIIEKINNVVALESKIEDMAAFKRLHIDQTFEIINPIIFFRS